MKNAYTKKKILFLLIVVFAVAFFLYLIFKLVTSIVPNISIDDSWIDRGISIISAIIPFMLIWVKKIRDFLVNYFLSSNLNELPKKLNELPKKYDESKIKVIWIDDDTSIKDIYGPILENYGCDSVKFTEDIRGVNEVLDYQIICCDYNGVGKAFGNDGSILMDMIRKNYYDKIVIAISSQNQFKEPNMSCDLFIQRGAQFNVRSVASSIQTWKNFYSHPSYFWRLCTSRIVEEFNENMEMEIKEAFIIDYLNNNTNELEKLNETNYKREYKTLIDSCKRYINLMKK
jgi:hypothetical protein